MTYLHEFLQPFGGWASRSLRPVHTLFSKWLPKAIATTKAPKAGSFSEMRGTYPTHPFLLLTSTGSSSWSFLVAKCCPHIFGFILTWKRHHVHRCLDNPPPLSFPPASWARFAGTLLLSPGCLQTYSPVPYVRLCQTVCLLGMRIVWYSSFCPLQILVHCLPHRRGWALAGGHKEGGGVADTAD